jgi:hypothetical protein
MSEYFLVHLEANVLQKAQSCLLAGSQVRWALWRQLCYSLTLKTLFGCLHIMFRIQIKTEPAVSHLKARHGSPNHLPMVIYDPIEAAQRCPTSFQSVDPSMAPKKVSGEPDYTASPFDLGLPQILPARKKSRALYKLVETGAPLDAGRYGSVSKVICYLLKAFNLLNHSIVCM